MGKMKKIMFGYYKTKRKAQYVANSLRKAGYKSRITKEDVYSNKKPMYVVYELGKRKR